MAVLMCATTLPQTFNFLNNNCNPHLSLTNNNNKSRVVCLCLSLKPEKLSKRPVISHGRDDDDARGPICPGCGVFMQDQHPSLPGFFFQPTPKNIPEEESELVTAEDDEVESKSESEDEFDWASHEEEEERWKKELAGFAPVGVGYGNVTEESMDQFNKERISKSDKKRKLREEAKRAYEDEAVIVCARCHSLRNSGQVKNPNADNLIPDFDFDRLITTRLMKPTGNSDASVVVMVVDCVDFDASFPKRAAKSLFKALEGSTKKNPKLKLPKLLLVATKVDLLPSQISPTRLDRWVRNRARANGAPKLTAVFLVSARKDLGVRNLLAFLKELSGPRGHVWVIGSQNAGKSTLINCFSKKEGKKLTRLTEAAVPGTTLGILRIAGILPAKAKMYDTPGLLHPYLMSMRLNRDEQKLVEIRKELKPRSYRIKAGQAIHVGAMLRLDLIQASIETIYVTIWASPNISLHMGKIENAEEIWRNHAGSRLQPPVGEDRLPELGQWQQKEYKVSGISWDVNSIDIAVAGLGWLSLGLKGEATLALWTYDGIQVSLREPLVLDRAPFLERPGFLLPKAVSEAIGNQSKVEDAKRKKLEENLDSFSDVM